MPEDSSGTDPRAGHETIRKTATGRLMPSMSFGLRAAALAGVVVMTGTAAAAPGAAAASATAPSSTVALGSPLSGIINPIETTCCGIILPI